jgi:hypothetical protein
MKKRTAKFIGWALLVIFVSSLAVSCARKGVCGTTKRGSKKKWKAFEKGF